VAKHIWILDVVDVLGIVLPARFAKAAATIKNKLPLRTPYLRPQISVVDSPPLPRVLASCLKVQAASVLSVLVARRLILSRHSTIEILVP
jgi:hypothetical protein